MPNLPARSTLAQTDEEYAAYWANANRQAACRTHRELDHRLPAGLGPEEIDCREDCPVAECCPLITGTRCPEAPDLLSSDEEYPQAPILTVRDEMRATWRGYWF